MFANSMIVAGFILQMSVKMLCGKSLFLSFNAGELLDSSCRIWRHTLPNAMTVEVRCDEMDYEEKTNNKKKSVLTNTVSLWLWDSVCTGLADLYIKLLFKPPKAFFFHLDLSMNCRSSLSNSSSSSLLICTSCTLLSLRSDTGFDLVTMVFVIDAEGSDTLGFLLGNKFSTNLGDETLVTIPAALCIILSSRFFFANDSDWQLSHLLLQLDRWIFSPKYCETKEN
jgi:hypothetical protein